MMTSEFIAVAIYLSAAYLAGAVIGTVLAQIIYIHGTKRRGGLWVPPTGLASEGIRHVSGLNTRDGRRDPDPFNAGRSSWPVR
jgi:hypothetical protein